MFRRPPSLRRVVFDGNCPGFIGTTQTLRLPAIPPAALRLPSLGGTTVAPVALLPCDHRRTSPGRGVVERGHPNAAGKSVEMTGSPKFPRNPLAATHMLLRPRKNQTELAFTFHSTRLRIRERPQLLRRTFEAQSHGSAARCLRFAAAGCPASTQDSLAAVG
jgi:hypothetical protein